MQFKRLWDLNKNMKEMHCIVISLITVLLHPSALANMQIEKISSKEHKNTEYECSIVILKQVKEYMERDDFAEVINKVTKDKVDLVMRHRNHLMMGTADPWPYLTRWTSFARALVRSHLKSGKMPMHFCEIITPIPTTDKDFEYTRINRILQRLIDEPTHVVDDERQKLVTSKLGNVRFNSAIRHRLEEDASKKREEQVWRTNITDSLTDLTKLVNFHHQTSDIPRQPRTFYIQ